MRRALVLAAGLAIAVAVGGPAGAGPPYVTDDPQTTDLGHWEIYNYVEGQATPGLAAGEGGLDLNYGAAKDVQLTLVVPAGWTEAGGDLQVGGGDIEAAAKFKLLRQDGFGLDVAVFPRLFIPTPDARFGTERVSLLLPVWAEKDFGKWQVFGGGGYQINPGPGQRNFWTGGLVVARDVSQRLNLGAEIYAQGPDAADARSLVGLNLGATWHVARRWSLLAAGGPGLAGGGARGQYDFYLALEATY